MERGNAPNDNANRPLRVLFLVDRMGYPDGTTHGGTTYFTNTLPELHRQPGIDLTVCFMGNRHPAAEKLESAGIEPIVLGRGKWNPLVFFDVLRLVKSRDIDVLHLASLKSLLFGRWASRMLKRGAIAHLHDMTPLPLGLGPLQRHAANWTDATLILTDAMRQFAQETWGLAGESVQVLPNGFDPVSFQHPQPCARAELRRLWGVTDDQPSSCPAALNRRRAGATCSGSSCFAPPRARRSRAHRRHRQRAGPMGATSTRRRA